MNRRAVLWLALIGAAAVVLGAVLAQRLAAASVVLASGAWLPQSTPLPRSRTVFITIDPQRDSAAALRVYLGQFGPRFLGVRGSPAALAPLLAALHVTATRQALPADLRRIAAADRF